MLTQGRPFADVHEQDADGLDDLALDDTAAVTKHFDEELERGFFAEEPAEPRGQAQSVHKSIFVPSCLHRTYSKNFSSFLSP